MTGQFGSKWLGSSDIYQGSNDSTGTGRPGGNTGNRILLCSKTPSHSGRKQPRDEPTICRGRDFSIMLHGKTYIEHGNTFKLIQSAMKIPAENIIYIWWRFPCLIRNDFFPSPDVFTDCKVAVLSFGVICCKSNWKTQVKARNWYHVLPLFLHLH